MSQCSPSRFALLLLSLSVCLHTAEAQQTAWTLLPNSPVTTVRLDDVTFINPSTGWVVDVGGFIHKTTDGGSTWTRLIGDETDLGYRVLFRAIGFANENLGWVGNLGRTSQSPDFKNILHETRDGGRTWTDITNRISGTPPAGLCGIWVVDDEVAYGVGRYGLGPSTFLKTTDGGMTWISNDMTDIAGVLIDVYFFDKLHGIIIGSTAPTDGSLDAWEDLDTVHAAVFMTSDGGETWRIVHQSSDLHEWGWKISFPTPSVGYVSTQGKNASKVLKTLDGGFTWTETPLAPGYGGSAIGFITEEIGWTGGKTTVLTTDGGSTWEEAGFGRMLNRIRVLGDTLAYAVGDRVYKYSHVPTLMEATDRPKTFQLEQNYPNPFNPATTITYTAAAYSDVEIVVTDLLARPVATLVERPHAPGRYSLVWNGTNDAGVPVPSGLYFYHIKAGEHREARAMVLSK